LGLALNPALALNLLVGQNPTKTNAALRALNRSLTTPKNAIKNHQLKAYSFSAGEFSRYFGSDDEFFRSSRCCADAQRLVSIPFQRDR
jgi:hypothetical protein